VARGSLVDSPDLVHQDVDDMFLEPLTWGNCKAPSVANPTVVVECIECSGDDSRYENRGQEIVIREARCWWGLAW
jgi:hypothetical protein